jgi:hypothetical protein
VELVLRLELVQSAGSEIGVIFQWPDKAPWNHRAAQGAQDVQVKVQNANIKMQNALRRDLSQRREVHETGATEMTSSRRRRSCKLLAQEAPQCRRSWPRWTG